MHTHIIVRACSNEPTILTPSLVEYRHIPTHNPTCQSAMSEMHHDQNEINVIEMSSLQLTSPTMGLSIIQYTVCKAYKTIIKQSSLFRTSFAYLGMQEFGCGDGIPDGEMSNHKCRVLSERKRICPQSGGR